MTAAPRLRFSFREYLRVDSESPVKHEFLDGMILAVAGGSPDHAALAMAIGALLQRQLEGRRCRVYSSDLRVRVPATGFAGYPDVTVICDRLEHDPDDASTATNPTVVVEILSPGTEHYDRGEKLRQYQELDSLLHVVLVAHDERRIEVWSRRESGWTLTTAGAGARVDLNGIDCTLAVDDVYRNPLSS